MDIFKRKNKRELPPLWATGELEQLTNPVTYEAVLEYLVCLSDEEYQQVCSVAAVHRAATKQEAEILGKEAKPSAFINPPQPEPMPEPRSFLDEDDGLGFLEDDHDSPASRSQRVAAKGAVDGINKSKAKGKSK